MRIFYSWQSDLPNRTNWTFIEEALRKAATDVGNDLDVDAVIDRDTAGLPGTPAIAQSILDKIREADVFVADVSIIGTAGSRKTSNPNVLAELGYAVGVLGWERVLLVFNSHFGAAEDLPFDIRHRKAAGYFDPDTDHDRGTPRADLAARLARSIKLIRVARAEGRLPPTLAQLQAQRVRDRTLERIVTPAQNLRRMNQVVGWGHTDQDLAPNIAEANEFAERIRQLPLPVAGALSVIVRRSVSRHRFGGGHALFDDVRLATGLSPEEFVSLVRLLEERSLVVVDDDHEGNSIIKLTELRSGWPFLDDLRTFCERSPIAPDRLLEELRFDLLDEVAVQA